jgi:hypothetical protein
VLTDALGRIFSWLAKILRDHTHVLKKGIEMGVTNSIRIS